MVIITFFELLGGYIRFLIYRIFANSKNNLDYYLKDIEGKTERNTTNDYYNGIVGFITFSLILTLAYFLFG